MHRWFTRYEGDTWNLQKVLNYTSQGTGLSERFAKEIEAMVSQLHLKPAKGEPKAGVVGYDFDDDGQDEISVVIKRFTFKEFRHRHGYHTPIFRYDLIVSAEKRGRIRRGTSPKDIVYVGPMIVTFGEDYPRRYPFFLLPKYEGYSMSHAHHMIEGGTMCLYNDFGRSTAAWDYNTDTCASAFGQAARWIVWHERDRHQGVSANDV